MITINIFISNASSQPIYDQIYSQIKALIISGELQTGEPLPSIRNLAKDLRISVITTKRAYDELEREGFINSVAGKGCFVAEKNVELIREMNLKKIEEAMLEIIQLAAACSLSRQDLAQMYDCLTKEE